MPDYFETGLMVGESAWHNSGTVIPADDPRRFDILACEELAEIDWQVVLGRTFYVYGDNDDDNEIGEVPGSNVTLRLNKNGTVDPLGVVGSKYRVLQNSEAFAWFQPWLETHEVAIETAGSLKGGRLVWVLAKILRDSMDVGGDKIDKYLMLSTSHDGSQATNVGFVPIRVVCWNTLSYAQQLGQLLRVRHTESQNQSLSTIRETIDLIDQQFNATAEQYQILRDNRVSLSDLKRYVKVLNGVDPDLDGKEMGRKRKRIEKMVQLAVSGRGQSPDDLTWWSAYNGVTEWLSHSFGKDSEARALSQLQGTAFDLNKTALELALELAA